MSHSIKVKHTYIMSYSYYAARPQPRNPRPFDLITTICKAHSLEKYKSILIDCNQVLKTIIIAWTLQFKFNIELIIYSNDTYGIGFSTLWPLDSRLSYNKKNWFWFWLWVFCDIEVNNWLPHIIWRAEFHIISNFGYQRLFFPYCVDETVREVFEIEWIWITSFKCYLFDYVRLQMQMQTFDIFNTLNIPRNIPYLRLIIQIWQILIKLWKTSTFNLLTTFSNLLYKNKS